jgi:hypothetical protein
LKRRGRPDLEDLARLMPFLIILACFGHPCLINPYSKISL